MSSSRRYRFILLVIFVVALLSLPFVLLGEKYALPLLHTQENRVWAFGVIAVALLTADSVAPVPSSLVIVALAAKAGWLVATIAGTLGLCGQVIGAAWFGRIALARVAARFLGVADMDELRGAVQQRLALTLGCLRSVPLIAETSVVVAASVGVPVGRICRATFLPNLAIAASYSIAAEAGLWAAGAAVIGSIAVSRVVWRATAKPSRRRVA